MAVKDDNEKVRAERMASYHFYLQSEEDDFGGFLPVETSIDELYPPVCQSCNRDECCVFGYLIILFLFGGAAAGVGLFVFVWEFSQNTNERIFLELLTPILGLVLTVFAGAMWVLATIGCVGTIKQSTKVLHMITIVFKVLLLLEVALSFLAFYYQVQVKAETSKWAEWMSFIRHYHEDPNLRTTMDSIQTRLGCCGFNSYKDWDENVLFSCSSTRLKTCPLPVSCCNNTVKKIKCGYEIENDPDGEIIKIQPQESVFTEGCLINIQNWYKYNLILISTSAVLLVVVQAILIFAISRLVRRIKDENMGECSEPSGEEELIPLRADNLQESIIIVRDERVTAERIHSLKAVLKTIIRWSANDSTREENI